ncbi:MAG: hypothetical protein IT322_18105 [Anaerolineae bacterium]|nr:hypothetical protein [Anaerolineae bacterium]
MGEILLRARYYVPQLGVFPSLDPVEEGNRYGYVGGDVVNRVDPSGMVGEKPERWNGCADLPLSPLQAAWSCVQNSTSQWKQSLYGKSAWACTGNGCQNWLDEALCVLMDGTPNHSPTPLTQWYADSVIHYNEVARAIKVGIDFDKSGLGADTVARFNISLPTAYLLDQDFQSPIFLEHVGVMCHEFWHTIQAWTIPAASILKEVEAYNIETVIDKDLGLVKWTPSITGLTTEQRMYMMTLGLPSPVGQGVTRDYCSLCKARSYLDSRYQSMVLTSEPIPVTALVCRQYSCTNS